MSTIFRVSARRAAALNGSLTGLREDSIIDGGRRHGGRTKPLNALLRGGRAKGIGLADGAGWGNSTAGSWAVRIRRNDGGSYPSLRRRCT
ncbi:uncharacterized protein BDZ83DRAFT_386073 [Colletotrichum acutatum]|uniref:Uncharacterized protein n=1 Tax=Glomerella acutata TaxID=27357 RepID=A0AAD8UIY8_GLOAC|nr:uncharacterized protein BDZ83DRAFT_386073 [Colletotrichum acutatum]KAK1723652.1 hypothetical protein BDZ83DRAFT_386073 [Colletotrichum acutatum]